MNGNAMVAVVNKADGVAWSGTIEERPCVAWVIGRDSTMRELLAAVLADEGLVVREFPEASDAVTLAARPAIVEPVRPAVLVVDTFRADFVALARLRRLLGQRTDVVAIREGPMDAELQDALRPTSVLRLCFDLEEFLGAVRCRFPQSSARLPLPEGVAA